MTSSPPTPVRAPRAPRPTARRARAAAAWAAAAALSACAGAALPNAAPPDAAPRGRAASETPYLDDRLLYLRVEVAWPAPPTHDDAHLWLNGWTATGSEGIEREGPLWPAVPRGADGWVAEGVVPIRTTHPQRLLVVRTADREDLGLLVLHLPARPTAADRAWSDWTPMRADGGAACGAPRVRYRVQTADEPVRVDSVGPFAVTTVASHLEVESLDGGRMVARARARLDVRVGGVPLAGAPAASEAVVQPGAITLALPLDAPRPALLVRREVDGARSAWSLEVREAGGIRRVPVDGCGCEAPPVTVTDDPARFAALRGRLLDRGLFDPAALAGAALVLVGDAVIDVPRLRVHPLPPLPTLRLDPRVPPLAHSPDRRRIVRYARTPPTDEDRYEPDGGGRPVLAVTDLATGRTEVLPVDPAWLPVSDPVRRLLVPARLDPSFVAGHYAWVRGPDGSDRLRARARDR